MLAQWHRVVAGGDEPVGDVAHQQRRSPAVPAQAGGGTDHRVVDRGWQSAEHSGGPHPHRPTGDVAHRPGEPVVVDVHHLEHVALAIDLDPLERRARLGVARPERPPPRRSVDEFRDR
jgi:hypothetical protein